MYSFSWTLQEPTDLSLSFVATNSMNALSLLTPRVKICACSNGGTCTLDGILSIQNNSVVMACECPEGSITHVCALQSLELPSSSSAISAWGGRFCEEDLNGCSQFGCFEGVQCYDVPGPGSGAICGTCPSGFSKINQKCAGKSLLISYIVPKKLLNFFSI